MNANPVRELLAARLVRGWVRLYTAGLPAGVRDGRREEIDGDLWEQVRDGAQIGRTPRYFRSDVLVRWLLGVPADLSWRVTKGARDRGIETLIQQIKLGSLEGMMALDSKQFLSETFGMVAEKHSKDHPLFDLIEQGLLRKEQLRGFVKQFYLLFPKPFPKPIAAMFARSPEDSELERMWMENLMEEAVGGQTDTAGHRDLYIRFAEACGIPRDELDATLPLPETQALLNWRELLISQRSWLELYACQGMALEGTASGRMHKVVNGLVDHYGFERDSEDILYWTVHMEVDEEHMLVGPYAIEKYAVSDLEQASVRRSLQITLDTFWLAYDGIMRAFVDNDPLYSSWREAAGSPS